MAPQFSDFRRVRRRMKRTLNFGSKQPQCLNFPLSRLVVDYFDKNSPFDYLKPETSTSIARRGYADPCSLVVALVYLDRLRLKDKEFFESSDPTDLYLPALVLASKYLHDCDTMDRASNSDWADAANISDSHLNNLEWDFVKKMDWDMVVKQEEFDRCQKAMENWVAMDFVKLNGFCTYNEMDQLSSALPSSTYLETLQSFLACFGLATLVYALSVVSLFAAPTLLSSMQTQSTSNSSTDSYVSQAAPSSQAPAAVCSRLLSLSDERIVLSAPLPAPLLFREQENWIETSTEGPVDVANKNTPEHLLWNNVNKDPICENYFENHILTGFANFSLYSFFGTVS